MNAALPDPAPAPAMPGRRRLVLALIALVFVVAGIAWYVAWVLVLSQRETTEDAYVHGNQVAVSARVPGTVVAVLADDTDRVEAGQVLVRLDPTDAELALARAEAALAAAVRQVRQQTELAGQGDAAVTARRQDLARAEADLARREPLLAERAIAAEELAHAREGVRAARAALEAAEREAGAARALVEGGDIAQNPAVLQARAAFREAWVNRERSAVLAPISGHVAQRSVQAGARVQPGQPLMTVIALDDVWVEANFKEGQLANIRLGQPATVRSDLHGSAVTYHGHVSGMAAGTGSVFALLPPQNASGNWIKVVQRVPVRIAIDPADLRDHPLRLGLSMHVKVDTSDREGAVLAAGGEARTVVGTDVYRHDLERADAAADAVIAAQLPAG